MRSILAATACVVIAGCASTPRGVQQALGGSDCCTVTYVEADPGDPEDHGGAVGFFECLSVDITLGRYLHRDACSCDESCICHRIANDNEGVRPTGKLGGLIGPGRGRRRNPEPRAADSR